jgi:hypothetical protein
MKRAKFCCLMMSVALALVAACSSSSGGSPDSGATVVATKPGPVDGGIHCGTLGGCAPPDECCMADPTAPTCVSQGACAGSSLGCSTAAQCSTTEVCCFAYGASASTSAAAAMPYSAQCSLVCATGDSVHYQLCATASECIGGGTCVAGPVAQYCMSSGGASPFPDLGVRDAGAD